LACNEEVSFSFLKFLRTHRQCKAKQVQHLKAKTGLLALQALPFVRKVHDLLSLQGKHSDAAKEKEGKPTLRLSSGSL
jgi:hypothetical protein